MPIEQVSRQMCKQTYPTLSFMTPNFDYNLELFLKESVKFQRNGILSDESETIADEREARYSKLLKYFECSSDIAILATVLDPRFKLRYYSTFGKDHSKIVEKLVFKLGEKINMV